MNISLPPLIENSRQEPVCGNEHSPMALHILPSSVFDNGAWIQTTSLIAQIRGSFWMLLAGSPPAIKPHCDHSGAVIFLD